MIDPDDDLRQTFQRWRAQDAEAAPAYREFPATPSASTASFPHFRPVMILGVASLLVLLSLTFWFARPQPITTLAEALPAPLLAPPPAGGFSLPGPSHLLSQTSPSDFLFPPSNSHLHFP
jgi:hypothetical protein